MAVAAILVLLGAATAQAASQIWNGNGADNNWSTTGNWVGGAAPGSTTVVNNPDVATFNGTGTFSNSTVNINSTTQNIGGITFDTAAAPAYIIGANGFNSGNTLLLTSGGTIQMTSTVGAVTETINSPINIEGSYTFTDNSANPSALLLFSGNVAMASAVTTNSALTVNGAGNTLMMGVISNGGNGTATLAVTKSGTGTLALLGTNTYTGGTAINGGTLTLGSGGALGTTGTISFGGGTLQYSIANQTDYSGRFSTLANQAISVDTNSQNVTFATALTSTGGSLTKIGAGTLTLSAANTYSGGTTVSGGVLQGTTVTLQGGITDNANVTFNQSITGTYAGAITGSGGVTVNGSGVVTFSGASSYVGPTTVTNGGTLNITGSLTGSALVLANGAFNGANATGTQTMSGWTVNSGASTIGETAAGALALGTAARNVGGTVNFTPPAGGGSISTTSTGSNGILGGWATWGGTDWAVGGGTIGPLAPASYTPDTWSAGNNTTVTLATNSPYNNVTTNSLQFAAAAADTVSLSGTNVITSGGILVSSAVANNATAITGGSLTSGNGTDLIVNQFDTSSSFTISSNIVDNGTPTGLTLGGASGGTVILNGVNTYSGGTMVAAGAGTLQGTTSGLQGNITDNAKLVFNNPAGPTGTYSGVISGKGTVTVNTTGTVAFSGANTYTGVTTAAGGVLELTSLTALPGGIANSGGVSGLTVNGGVIGLGLPTANLFGRSLGAGANQVQFTGNSGFAGYAPGAVVNIGASISNTGGTAITWSAAPTGSWIPNGSTLTLGAADATSTIVLQNAFAFGTARQTINVIHGAGIPAGVPDAIMSGALSATNQAGGAGITLTGNGTLQLVGTADNPSFTAIVNSGATLILAKTSPGVHSLGGSGAGFVVLTINSGGTVQLGNIVGALPIGGAGGDQIFNGGTDGGVNNSGTLDLNGTSEAINNLLGASTGVVTNTLAGTTSVLTVGTSVSPGSVSNYAGVIQNGGATKIAGLTVGAASLTLSGANTYTGLTTVSNANLTVTGSLTGTGLVIGNGAFTVNSAAATTMNNWLVGSGEAVINNNGAGNLALGSLFGRLTGGTVNFTVPGAGGGSISTTSTGSNGILAGFATIGGTDWAVGGGTITALNAPGGTVWVDGTTNLNLNGNSSAGPGASVNSLLFSTANSYTVTLTGANSITSGGILVSSVVGANASAITGGSLTSGNGGDLIVNQFNAAGSLTISSAIVNNGVTPIGLTVNGPSATAGMVVLGATNTYTGPTFVNGGAIQTTAVGGLPRTTDVTLNGALDLAGNAQTIAALTGGFGSLTGATSGTVTNSGAATVLTFGGGGLNLSTTFGGTIKNGAGTLGVTMQGYGTQTLNGANTYTGPTTVNAGVLSVPGGDISASSALVLGGGTYSDSGTQTVAGWKVNAAGSTITNTTGSTTLTLGALASRAVGGTVNFGSSTANPGGTINTSTASVNGILGGWATFGGSNWANSGTGGGNIAAAALTNGSAFTSATVNYNVNATATAGGLTANSMIINNGGNAVTLSLASGTTTFTSGGILMTNNTGNNLQTIQNNSLTSGNGTDLIVINNDTNNGTNDALLINSQITGTIGLTKSGPGAVVLGSGSNNFSGVTTVNTGVLQYNVAGAVGLTSGIAINYGGTVIPGSGFSGTPPTYTPLATLSPLITASSTGTIALAINDGENFTPTAPIFLGAATNVVYSGTLGAVNGAYRFGGGGLGTLTVTGPLTGANSVIVAGNPTSQTNANGTGVVNGLITNTTVGNSGGIVGLYNQNTYSGGTLVQGGFSVAQAVLTADVSSIVSGGALVSGPIGTGTLTLNGSGFQDGSMPITLANSVVINGTTTLGSAGNGTLTFSSAGLTTPSTIALEANSTLTVNNISTTFAESVTGAATLTKSGIGNLVLSGTNTYSGGTIVNGTLGFGTLEFLSPASIAGSGANVTVNAGAAVAAGPIYGNLQSTFFNRILYNSAGTIALSGSSIDNYDWSSSGANFITAGLGALYGNNVTYAGSLTPNGVYRLGGGGGTLNFAAPLTGASSVTLFNDNMAGTVVLGGENTYSGGTTVNGTIAASWFSPGLASQTVGKFASVLQVNSSSAVSGGGLQSGPVGTGPIVFNNSPAVSDNGANITLANSLVLNAFNTLSLQFMNNPSAFTSAGNGSLILDGGPGTTISFGSLAAAQSIAVNNTTIIKDPIVGTLSMANAAGNPYVTIGGTGTLILAAQSTYSFSGTNNGTNVNFGTLLLAGPSLRFAVGSTVAGTFGSQTLVSGPVGTGALSINGAGNTGSFLQDNGTNITLANSVVMNLANPVNFDSTGAGSLTFDGTGLSAPAFFSLLNNNVTLITDNTTTINDRIIGTGTGAILTVGNNNNKYPYGTLVLNQPANASITIPGSNFSGGTVLNFGTLVVGASTIVSGSAPIQSLVSGPLGTGTLTLSINSPILEDNGTNITLANNVSINAGQGGFIIGSTGNGSITFDGTGLTSKATLNMTGSATTTAVSWIVNNTVTVNDRITGTQSIIMGGNGKLILGAPPAANSYFNAIAEAGVLQLNALSSFGNGTVSLGGVSATPLSLADFGGTLAAGPAYTNLQVSFFNHISNTSAGTIAITANSSEAFNWSSSGGSNFVAASLGAVGGTLASPVVYSGALTPNGTTYRLGGGGGALSITGALSSADSLVVGGGGSGGAVIINNGSAFTGVTTVSAGTLQLNTAPGVPANFPGIITVGSGAAVSAGASYGSITTNLLPLLNVSSTGAIALSGSSSESLSFSGVPSMSLGAEATTSVTYSGTLTPANSTYLLGGGGGTLTVSSNLTGANSLVIGGNGAAGTVIPTGTNTFSGGATLSGGKLQLSAGTVSGTTITSGPVGTGTLTLANGILQDNGSGITLANSVALVGSTTLTSAGGGSLTFDGTGLTSPATFTIASNPVLTVANTTTINDVISGSSGFTKAGSGTLVLGGTNIYTGPTNILGGTVRATAAGALPGGTTVNLSLAGTLDLNGNALGFDQLTGAGTVTNGGAATTLTLGGSGGSNNFAGTIQNGTGAVALTKSGAGTLTLSGANTFSGGTTLSGGTLRVGSGNAAGTLLGAAPGTVLSNATGTTTIASGPFGTGALTLGSGTTLQDSGFATALANPVSLGTSGGTFTFSSPSALAAFASPNSGSLTFDGTALGTKATVNLTGATILTVNNALTINDQITGASALTMSGSGTLVLANTSGLANGYTTMNVTSGVVQYNGMSSVGSGLVTIGSGGAVAVGPGIGVSGGATTTGTPISSMLSSIATGSSGTIALTESDSESVSFASYPSLSLGTTANVVFSGSITPAGSTYLLGGGGGTLTVAGGVLSGGNGLTVGGAGGGTVVLSGSDSYSGLTTVNAGVLQLGVVGANGSNNITVNAGGAVAAGPGYNASSATPVSSLLSLITTGSQGTLALASSTSENLNFSSYSGLSLGAAAGPGVAYSGTLTPNGSTYRLGGGGGTLNFASPLTGSNALVVGSGSGGSVILSNATATPNNYSNGTIVAKGNLAVGPTSSVFGSGQVQVNNGATLTLLAPIAPVATTGYTQDVIWGPGEASPQSGTTAGFGDGQNALYQKGMPGSQAVGNIGLPATRSFVSLGNPNAVFQLQPYNAKNDLALGSGGIANNADNRQNTTPTGTLTLANPGSYSSIAILNGTSNGNNWFSATLNFSNGTSFTQQGLFAGDWFTPSNYNAPVNGVNPIYTIAYSGAGYVTMGNNNGTFLGGGASNTNGSQNAGGGPNFALPRTTLYETDVQVPLADQNLTLTSVTITHTGSFTGANNGSGTDANAGAGPNGHMNIMGLSGTLTGSITSGSVSYSNDVSIPASATSTIDLQNAEGATFSGQLLMGNNATLNVTNSTGAVSDGQLPSGGQPFNLTLGSGTVQVPATSTFNVSSGAAGGLVNLTLGQLNAASSGAVLNFTGSGTVTLGAGTSGLSGAQVNISNGGTLIDNSQNGLGSTAAVNIATGATLAVADGGSQTVSMLAGSGAVRLGTGAALIVGSSDNMSNAVTVGLTGNGAVGNGGNGTLTLNGGNFANTTINSNVNSPAPGVVSGNTTALGGTVTFSGGVLKMLPAPGSASMSGFGNNWGIAPTGGTTQTSTQSNGWTITDNPQNIAFSNGYLTSIPNFNLSTNPYTVFPSVNVLQLTDGGTANEARSAFYSTPVPYASGSSGFSASFTYTPGLTKGGNGVALVLQNDPRGAAALVAAGSGTPVGLGLGYQGITNSVAIELNIWNGALGGVGTALGINGTVPGTIAASNGLTYTPVKWLNDGDPINVSVSYSPTAQTLTETVTDSLVPANTFSTVYTGVNLASVLNGPSAYVGFTGASQNSQSQQLISNFSYSLSGGAAGNYATNVAVTGSGGTMDLAATVATPNFTMGGLTTNFGGALTISAQTAPGTLNYGVTFKGSSALPGNVTLNVYHAGALNGGGTDGTGTGLGTVTIAGQITGSGGITNNGPGIVQLTALNRNTGGVGAAGGTIVAGAVGALGSGTVTLGGGTLQLKTAQPYASAQLANLTPVALTGWNQDSILAANQATPATIVPLMAAFDGGGPSHAAGSVLFEHGAVGSGGTGGLPAAPSPGAPASFTSLANSNVTFQFQPYSTASGGLVNNDLQLNSSTTTAKLTLTTPAQFDSISVLHGTGNGPGGFNMILNFANAPSLTVGSAAPDWFSNPNFAINASYRYTTGANPLYNAGPANPNLLESDYTLPAAYQGATLQSITFNAVAAGEINIMAVSGTTLTTSNLNATNVTASSTIDVTGTASSALTGTMTMGNFNAVPITLSVTGGSTAANQNYTLNLATGAASTVSLTGSNTQYVFNVSSNGSGIGALVLGPLNDLGTARNLAFNGTTNTTTTLGTVATSLVQGTTVSIGSNANLVSSAAGTNLVNGSLGRYAQVTVASGGTLTVGANQTISSLSGSGSVALGSNTLSIGNDDNLSSTFSGVISGAGSINVGIPLSSGSLTLSGGTNNSYLGSTTVSGGTLNLQTTGSNNIPSSAAINVLGGTLNVTGVTGSGGFTVASGQTLQGATALGSGPGGTVVGSVTVGSSGHIGGWSISPKSSPSITLNVTGAGPSLTLPTGSISDFTLDGSLANNTAGLIATTSGSGTSLSVSGANTVNVTNGSTLPTVNSTYELYSYNGTLTNTGNGTNALSFTGGGSMTLGNLPQNALYQYSLSNVTSGTTHFIDLTVKPVALTWSNLSGDMAWNTTSINWVDLNNNNVAFANTKQVIFGDVYGAGNTPLSNPQTVIVQAAGVQPGSGLTGVTFGNNLVNYTIQNQSGTIGIAGATGIQLVGDGAAGGQVTLDSPNSFSGPVSVKFGQLNLGDGTASANAGNALGASSGVTVGTGTSLNLNSVSGSHVTFGNSTSSGTIPLAISGIGTGLPSVAGALNSQSGINTYTGPITIAGGAATIGSTSIAATDGLILSGQINNASNTSPASITFQGAGSSAANGAIVDLATGVNALSIVVAGPGDATLGGPNTYHGTTTVSSGLLILASQNALGNTTGGLTIGGAVGLVLNNSGPTGLKATGGAGIPLSLSGTGTGATIPGTSVNSNGALTDVGVSGYGGPISLPTDATIATTGLTDVLTLSGAVTIGTNANPQTLTFVGPGGTVVNGAIGDGGVSAAGSIAVNGGAGGIVTFAGANTYLGTTTVNSGALALQSATALGNTSGTVTVNSGGALVLTNNTNNSATTFGLTAANSSPIPLSLAGGGATGNTAANGGTGALTAAGTGTNASVTWASPITINSGASIAAAAANNVLNLSALVNSTGATTTLNGPGTINVNGGLNISTSGALVVPAVNGGGTYTIGNGQPISDGGTSGTVSMSGSGTLNLATSNFYAGGTTVAGGLTVASTTFSLGTGPVTLGGGTLRLSPTSPVVSGFGGGVGATSPGWSVNNANANFTVQPFPIANVLQLTDAGANTTSGTARSAWYNASTVPIANGFTVSFTYQSAGGADGGSFMLQNDARGVSALGGTGGAKGASGITPSAELVWNIYTGGAGNIVGTALDTNGTLTADTAFTPTTPVSINSNHPINVVLSYNPTTNVVTETLTDTNNNNTFSTTVAANLTGSVGNVATIGFTGGTGGVASNQTISNFSFVAGQTATYSNSLTMNSGTISGIDVAATVANPAITVGPLTVNSGAASTLNVTATTAPTGVAYGLNVGAVTLNGDAIFNVANNTVGAGNATGTLTLGALSDGGGGRTISVAGAGNVFLGTVATSMQSSSTVNAGLASGGPNGGNLVISSTTGSPTGTAAVNVNNGGSLSGAFSGAGSIAGLVTVNGGGTIRGSNAAALAGTPLILTGGLTFAATSPSPSFSSFSLTTTPNGTTNPMINVSGSTLAFVSNAADTVKLTGTVPTTLATYTYDLFAYAAGTVTSTQNGTGLTFTGANSGSMSLDAIANLPLSAVYSYQLVNNTALSQIDVVLTPAPLTWTGKNSGNWDVNTTQNWANGTTPVNYLNGAAVSFADKSTVSPFPTITNTTVTITPTAGVQPAVVVFSNTGPGNGGVNYVMQNGAGNNVGIGGSAAVTVQGAGGQVTFSGANSFTGALQVAAGQLNLADTETIGGSSYSLGLGNASSAAAGTGATPGTLQLQAATGVAVSFGNAYNGGGLVAGSLTGRAIGLTLGGATSAGTLNSTTGNNTYVGAITLGAGGGIVSDTSVATGDALTLSGAIGDGGAGSPGSLTKSGAGTVNLPVANSYFGTTAVSAGTLVLSNSSALGNSSAATVTSGGTLALTGGTGGSPLTYGNLVGGGGGTIPLTLNGNGAGAGIYGAGALANSGVNTWAGPITLASNSTVATTAVGDALTLSGAIGGSGALAANGAGKVTLSAVNSYAGGTMLNASLGTTGTVASGTTFSLGSGPVTLNAGTLRVAPFGLASGFGGNGIGWQQNGTGAPGFINSNVLELTVNPVGATRSAFYKTLVPYQNNGGTVGFSASFTYQFQNGSNPPADGITFVLQNDTRGPSAIGGGGGLLGYGDTNTGIKPSAAVELNIYPPNNPTLASGGTFFGTNGTIGNNATNFSTAPVVLASPTGSPAGNPINVTLAYDPVGQTLTENLVDLIAGTNFSHTYTGVNMSTILGGANSTAYVGFTGATGGSFATQDITNFQYTVGAAATYANNVTLAGADTATIDLSSMSAVNPAITMGTLTVGVGGAATLNVTDATDAAGSPFTLNLGATTLNSSVTFNVVNGLLSNGAGTLTLAGLTESGGSFSVTKDGVGTLAVTAPSAYTGGTTVLNGTLTTTSTGSIGNGSLILSVATGKTSVVNLGSNQAITSLATTGTGTGSATLNVASGTTLTDTQTTNTTFPGKVALASTATMTKAGIGTLEIDKAPSLGAGSIVNVNAGSVKFNVATGSATVGAGVTPNVNVNGAATLELANSVSALSDGTAAHSAQINNNSSAAAGLLVSGTASVQRVGGIDGTGTTQVNAGDSLTANHIVQGALIIGGTSTSAALVTIDASDASGNPLVASSGLAVASSLDSNEPFASGTTSSSTSLLADNGSSSTAGSTLTGSAGAGGASLGAASVPEPSSVLLLVLGSLACLVPAWRRRIARK
ncbi:MAG TPA: autotransporter-associated beta strand repeat-containing protein [Pirellulales bacterium]|nr:autotransporter-associated beta strand repeat-containing protein [Pirellulales bacterium]